ncbi:MAG: phage/plasmid primase, P4 family, partial [Thermodesulfobacteriota bacterium]
PHDQKVLATYQLPVTFDPAGPADCPMWKDFTAESIQDEGAVQDFQEFMGYCLTRYTKHERWLLLIGPRASGKSTALKILQRLVGLENCSNVDFGYLDDQFHKASLYGKVLNVCAEIEGAGFSTQTLKSVASGDRITAAFKHMQPFEFEPFCKLAFAANSFPRVSDNTSGFFEKVLPIEFKVHRSPEERDPDLFSKLLLELSGIFGWAWLGLISLRKRGHFRPATATEKAIDEYRRENNPVLEFIEECCEVDPAMAPTTSSVTKPDLYLAYARYCRRYGYMPQAEARFARVLREVAPRVRDRRPRGPSDSRCRVWLGLRLIDPPAPPDDEAGQRWGNNR